MSPSPVIQTRVYPLATINASQAFGEVMKTLEDVLSTSGVPKEQVKIAFHEKTNVLVIRGPAEAQAMVEQLLAALGKNNAQSREGDDTRKVTTLEVRLEAMMNEMERLKKQLDQSDAERRELEKVNQRLQDQVPQKSDRK